MKEVIQLRQYESDDAILEIEFDSGDHREFACLLKYSASIRTIGRVFAFKKNAIGRTPSDVSFSRVQTMYMNLLFTLYYSRMEILVGVSLNSLTGKKVEQQQTVS